MRRYFILLLAASNHCLSQEVIHVQNGATVTIQTGAYVSITGGIALENGSVLSNAGTVTLNGDWADYTVTPYDYGMGKVVFSSAGSQSFTSKNIFGQIEVNTGSLNLGSDVQANKWHLTSGVINTNGFIAIAKNAVQLAVEADAANLLFVNSWFNGSLRRYISPTDVNTYSFPVSDGSSSRLAVLDNLQATPLNNVNYVDFSFGSKPGTDAGLSVSEQGTPYTAVNTTGVWYITPDVQPTSGKYDLQVYVNGFTGLEDNKFAILQRPVVSSDAAEWIVPAGSSLPAAGTDGRIVSAGFARRNNMNAFSQFGIGMTLSALPVTLTDFTAKRVSSYAVSLDWSTASEQNNRGFSVERKLEHESTFSARGFVPSAAANGNSSNLIQYHFTDPNGDAATSYYRLKQINFDNGYSYSVIKTVAGAGISISLYPNPARGQINIRIEGSPKNYICFMTDASGRNVKTFNVKGSAVTSVGGLAPGSYILTIPNMYSDGQSYNEKIIIVR